jgi:hypothetical protein
MILTRLRALGCAFLFCFFVPDSIAAVRVDSLHELKTADDFSRLSASLDSSTFARTDTLKFMVDRKNKRTLWFFDTNKYTYHYAFARAHLSGPGNPVPDHALFNQREYSSKHRRFEMGTLVYYRDQDLWVMELVAGDNLNALEIGQLYAQVRTSMWNGSKLKFLPLSLEQETEAKKLAKALPIVSAEDIYKGIRYQPLTQGKSFGYLRIVKGALDMASVRPNQILVLEKLPEEIPVVAGVISQELQAPLAHIALLCGARGTPNMGLRNALEDKNIQALDGKLVELNVQPQEFSLAAADPAVAEQFWKSQRPVKPKVPKANLKEKRLLDVSELRMKSVVFAGAKAAQLGEVSSIKPALVTPGGFVVPLSHYVAHIAKPNIAARLNDVFADTGGRDFARLDALRSAIETAPVDASLLAAIKSKMAESGHAGRWILRSSTNAEDLPGFNGAGLYRSIKLKAGASDTELADALRQVWASVWLQGALEERAWYGVDHKAVGMAVLVQPYVEGAIANGVAITANPFAAFRPGVLINLQPKGGSVTGAVGNEIPEQHLVYTYGEQPESELLARSSRLPEGKTLLDSATLLELTNQLVRLHEHLLPRWSGDANAVDVEFLVMPDNSVVILQARPYRVIYSEDQRSY